MSPSALALPDRYILVLLGSRLLVALVVWLPLSLPIVCVALGELIFSLPQVTLKPLPFSFRR